MPARILLCTVAIAAMAAAPARGATTGDSSGPQYKMIGGNPGPQHNYICPNADGQGALDCYFDAVAHLYTMCKHVKSIEIIEFGYEKSDEGTNGAKSEYCLDKQKLSMTRPYQSALREASISQQAVEGIRSLQEYWLQALGALKWHQGESDDDYKTRTARPYDDFRERIEGIRKIVTIVKDTTTPAPKPVRADKKRR
jgi:hypothetical protein